jgi:hypothetical protein
MNDDDNDSDTQKTGLNKNVTIFDDVVVGLQHNR